MHLGGYALTSLRGSTRASMFGVFSLGNCKLFVGVDAATLTECAAQFTALNVGRRRHLYVQGEPSSHLYCLVKGVVRVGRLTEDGLDLTLRILGRGDIFGEDSLFGRDLHSASATALDDCIIAVCRGDRVKSLLLRHPLLALNVAQCVCEYHDRTVNLFQMMALRRVRERLMLLLRELAEQCGAAEPHGTRIEAVLTHAELASLVGASRETVTYELNELARTGQILRRGRQIIVPRSPAEAA